MSDAYIGYEFLHPYTQGRIQIAGCYVHARRKFEELHDLGPTERTATAMGYFQRLFDIEDELRQLSDEKSHEQRQLRSRPLLQEMGIHFPQVTPTCSVEAWKTILKR